MRNANKGGVKMKRMSDT